MFKGPAVGLYSSPNPFSQTPDGTLKVANNVRFTAPGVLGPRRGFDYLADGDFGDTDSRADSFAFYAGDILLAYDLTKVSLYQTGSGFTDFTATLEPVGANRMRFEGAARSCFFNTSQGLKVWDGTGVSDEPVNAGNPLGLYASAHNKSANGWQEADTAVAYRFTICGKDAFGRVIEGPPSGRVTLINKITTAVGALSRAANVVTATTGLSLNWLQVGDVVVLTPGEAGFAAGAKTVASVSPFLTSFTYAEVGANAASALVQEFEITRSAELHLQLPESPAEVAVTTSNFLRLYRSLMTAPAASTPSDELFQCYESGFLTAGNVAAGYLVVADTTPEDQLEVPLYTNVNTGVGALQANYQPPLALDIAYWSNRMWFANTTNKHALQITLLGVGSPDGLQSSDTVTIAGTTYTAGVDFVLTSYGEPGFNIEQTAQQIVIAVNLNAQEDVFAYYVSTEGGEPGRMLFVAREFGDTNSFQAFSSRATPWSPQLPTFVAPAFPPPDSDDNRHPAGLFYSRLGKPEAVPLVNSLLVNSDNDAILRIFPLHYRLLIFKTDGIYACTNVEPFSITKLSAYKLLAPDSVQVLDDRVYALTDQGIITISDAGVAEVSNPVDDVFNELDAPAAISGMATRTFGLSYRSERQYLAWCLEKEDDGGFTDDNAQAYTLSTLSQGYTRYPFGVRCGAIDPDANAMVVAPTDDNALWLENKALTDADFYDLSFAIGVPVAVSGEALTFSVPTAALIEAGDVLGTATAKYFVSAVDGVTVSTYGATGWTTGTTLTLFKAIECEVEFNKLTAGTPAELKMMQQASLLFRTNGIHDTTATFSTEITPEQQEVTLSADGWGDFPWGELPWGSPPQQIRRIEPLPTSVAQCAQLSVGFRTRQAMARFEFLGLDVLTKKDTSVNRG